MTVEKNTEQVFKEIEKVMGFLPDGFKSFSKNGLPGAWKALKDLEMNPETEIPNRYKELMNVAIASQIPSKYCVHTHVEYALSEGASQEQINEAISIAAIVRRFSTFLNGVAMDLPTFKKDIDQVVSYQKTLQITKKSPSTKGNGLLETSAQAFKDMDHTLGLVPKFLLAYPEQGVAGVWKEFKELQLNPETTIPNKYKELIGLGISAQIPCPYCIYFHTEVSKLNGATAGEISEAAAIAGGARHWSAAFNGFQKNYDEYEKQFDLAAKKMHLGEKTSSHHA